MILDPRHEAGRAAAERALRAMAAAEQTANKKRPSTLRLFIAACLIVVGVFVLAAMCVGAVLMVAWNFVVVPMSNGALPIMNYAQSIVCAVALAMIVDMMARAFGGKSK